MDPLSVPAKQARAVIGNIGNNKFYELVNEGEIESYLDGSKRMVTTRSLRAYVERKLAESAHTKLPAPPEPHARKERRRAATQTPA